MTKSSEEEKEVSRPRQWRRKHSFLEAMFLSILLLGTVTLVESILSSSSILAFIGLGLTFWGALFLFIRPGKCVDINILDSIAFSQLEATEKIIADLNYKGKAVYLPPQYLKESNGGMMFISSSEEINIPREEEIAEGKVFLKNPQGMCLPPLGLDLANLYEKKLQRRFTEVDMQYLQENLSNLLTEDLEIAQDVEINAEDRIVRVKITKHIFQKLCKETGRLQNICNSIGCPLCSSIAVALTRSTGQPVIIDETRSSEDGETIEASYAILSSTEDKQTRAVSTKALSTFIPFRQTVRYLLPFLISLVLVSSGLGVLVWVGWLMWYDITTWGKSLSLIFFGSRTGEAISLGIGMRVIYYFLAGSILFLLGIFTSLRRFLRKRQGKTSKLNNLRKKEISQAGPASKTE